MKNIFWVLFFLIHYVFDAKAQTYFSRTYPIPENVASELAVSMIETNSNYIFVGSGRDLRLNEQYLLAQGTYLLLDKDGENPVFKKLEPLPDSTFSNPIYNITKISMNKYLSAGISYDTSDVANHDILLVWTDSTMTTLATRTIAYARSDYGTKIKILPNGDILLLGTTYSFSDWDYGQIYLARLDSVGNILWERTFGYIGYEESQLDMLISDNHIYITGGIFKRSIQYIRSFVLKTDMSGNYIDMKNYQIEFYNFSNHVHKIESNKFALVGTVSYDWTDNTDPLISMVDSNLNLINYKIIYPIDTLRQLFFDASLYDAERGLLVSAYSHYNLSTDQPPLSGLIATDTAGNIRWQQEYYTRTDFPQYLYDIQKTNDGGYIMCGSAFPDSANATQDFWVIKTDSVGCIQNCITAVPPPASPSNTLSASVFPNPSTGSFTVLCKGKAYVSVTNSMGKTVSEFKMEEQSAFGELLNKGVYFVRLISENKQVHLIKIIKQ